mmetsp:Transcript_3790/g.6666  ORF Transcript_3790/g.6666 Transcript_3790/m.6666 type:complete len:115 (-) Transcript_3790:588-932(-)
MSDAEELACVYAALILHDDNLPITADKMSTIIKAAGLKVEAYWPVLFAKMLANKNLDDLLMNVGAGGGAVASVPTGAAAAAAPAAGAPKEAEKKKEEPPPKEESEEDMGLGLFD